MSTQCVICTRDTTEGYVDSDCLTTLLGDLVTLAWLAAELLVTRNRQARVAAGGGDGGAPLGYHIGAARTYAALHNALVGWVRIFEPGRGEHWPRDTAASMVAYLLNQADRIRRHAAADQFAAEVRDLTERALETINPPDPSSAAYGVCGAERRDGTTCLAHLYGESRAEWVRCRACDTQHDARKRVDALQVRARTLYFRAATLARLLPRFIDRPVSASNIRNWAVDGRPIRTGTDEDGWTTYHCGDTIAVALSTPKRNRMAKAG